MPHDSYSAMPLVEQLIHQRCVQPGPLVLRSNPLKFPDVHSGYKPNCLTHVNPSLLMARTISSPSVKVLVAKGLTYEISFSRSFSPFHSLTKQVFWISLYGIKLALHQCLPSVLPLERSVCSSRVSPILVSLLLYIAVQ